MPKSTATHSEMTRVRNLVAEMPDDSTIEYVQYRLYVMETIGRRMKSIECGPKESNISRKSKRDSGEFTASIW